MIPPIRSLNVDAPSPDNVEPRWNHKCWALHTALLSTFFRLDPPLFGLLNSFNILDLPQFDHKKTDEEPMGKFL